MYNVFFSLIKRGLLHELLLFLAPRLSLASATRYNYNLRFMMDEYTNLIFNEHIHFIIFMWHELELNFFLIICMWHELQQFFSVFISDEITIVCVSTLDLLLVRSMNRRLKST
ncbi:hypothetical protein ACJX0J_014972, partial [Zea mays]